MCIRDSPYAGGAGIICENVRNLACVGARARAMVDNLNFGNPEKPEIAYQFRECIKGISDACKTFNLASVGGNVSFYNEDEQRGLAIKPTPVVVCLGVVDSVKGIPKLGFSEGQQIVLVGKPDSRLGGSEYLRAIHNVEGCQMPEVDPEAEKQAVDFVLKAIEQSLIEAAHDISKGGLAVALAEMCIAGGVGAEVDLQGEGRADALLFSEGGVKFVLGTRKADQLKTLAESMNVPIQLAGKACGEELRLSACKKSVQLALEDAISAYAHGIEL